MTFITMNNPFAIYQSKVKRINIPLPEYKVFHRASNEMRVDEKFIGRDNISRKLYSWLTDKSTLSGSYLVTGYRGMGKSSFVGRILNELSTRMSRLQFWIGMICFFTIWICLSWIILLNLSEIMSSKDHVSLKLDNNSWIKLCDWFLLFNIIIFCFFFVIILHFWYPLCSILRTVIYGFRMICNLLFRNKRNPATNYLSISAKIRFLFVIFKSFLNDWPIMNRCIHNVTFWRKSFRRICVNVNLGQDTLNERDVLSIIAYELYKRYKLHVQSPIASCWSWFISTILVFVFSWGALYFLNIETAFYNKFIYLFRDCLTLKISDLYLFILEFLFALTMIFLGYLIISRFLPYTQHRALSKLKFLRDRLDSTLEIDSSFGGSAKTDKIRYFWGKRRNYQIAQVREIEQELIDVLDRISFTILNPSFIFVFDELDKIETNLSQKETSTPEFSNEKNFPGGGTSRIRKRNVLHLLANMKLFVSSAKAKFIFISGRELYDAYLADLSDREFSISSIFNGVIYVESFCSNERREKDIMSNTETYISKQLIPKYYLRRKLIHEYIGAKVKGRRFDGMDISLKMYYEYLIHVYSECYGESELSSKTITINDDCYQSVVKSEMRECIDKTIIFLYHFSVYLYHISNGSPKKMCLYFEKYIRKSKVMSLNHKLKKKRHQSDNFMSEHNINIYIDKATQYCLSFGYMDQRNIGFIHYISYPIMQIINNSNQFGDKLLVSASFLIDHIYKYHNGGFSWRNLEHTPELLEVYRIPEFRSYINAIISYLTQTHLIPISCGLYQFKFRKRIAEEISLASKFSEEISAMFNFTLDESQTVKQHYLELQQHYNNRLKQEGTMSPHEKAGIHHILADLYMADEEYTNAILEYQTAVKIILGEIPLEIDKQDQDKHIITYILFFIRNMLKLGLAFEKRRTYESAYVTYNELISRLIGFRNLNEDKLGLNYVIRKGNNDWPNQEVVLYSKIKGTSKEANKLKSLRPKIDENVAKYDGYEMFNISGQDFISDFSHQMTSEKDVIIRRLSMLEDIRLVYQALLAKLFVLEKMELSGITRTNLEIIESEYTFLHLATNDKDKFLISSDFFRRLGDIMFYKNGLSGNDVDTFVEGLFYWAFNPRTEVLDFCNQNDCYHLKDDLYKILKDIKNKEFLDDNFNNAIFYTKFDELLNQKSEEFIANSKSHNNRNAKLFTEFGEIVKRRLNEIPLECVRDCNMHRKDQWEQNHPLPCYACKYYNRSLRIILKNLYGIDMMNDANILRESKTMIVLKLIVQSGTSRSLRQNFILQLAEDLDCIGNVMLCCLDEIDNTISKDFLDAFFNDVIRTNCDSPQKNIVDYDLYKKYHGEENQGQNGELTKLEKVILYYWEASLGFRFASEPQKASLSLKKILRTLQNYLKTSLDKDNGVRRRLLIGDYINDIKNHIIKQCLLLLYEHYNFINITEIQKLKWVFNVQMYEHISLSRLSLFPDVEEILLIYYDLLRFCIFKKETTYPNEDKREGLSWGDSLERRNDDFMIRLCGVYQNSALSSLRIESSIYERILMWRFKTDMNKQIFHHLCSNVGCQIEEKYYDQDFLGIFICFLDKYLRSDEKNKQTKLNNYLGNYSHCFPRLFDTYKEMANYTEVDKKESEIKNKLMFLEFIIKDSIYCLTRILEIITPYTATTMFTNSFLGEIYQMLFCWNQLFDALFISYKVIEEQIKMNDKSRNKSNDRKIEKCCYYENNDCPYIDFLENDLPNKEALRNTSSKCPHYALLCCYKSTQYSKQRKRMEELSELKEALQLYQKLRKDKIADRFFNDVLLEIGRSHIIYTISNYSAEMSIKSYRQALEMHREGKAYKNMITKMYYLDDDLKNDTIQFDSTIERYKINRGYISENIEKIKNHFRMASLYDIENFGADNETLLPIHNRFAP